MDKKDFLRTIITGDENIISPGDLGSAEKKFDLSVGAANFANALQKRLGSHDPAEIETMGNVLLNTISQHIEAGEQIAFVKRNKDGTLKLTTFSIEEDK